MSFYEKFLYLCICEDVSPSAAAEAIGSTRASATRWKNGSTPSDATIKKLSDYFNVPFEYFSDDSNEKAATPEGSGLTATQRVLIEKVKLMTDAEAEAFLALLNTFEARRKGQDAR